MSKTHKTAEEILREETGEVRSTGRFEKGLIGVIAIAWAVFQLSLASFLILDGTTVRAVHLAFAIAILFLSVPMFKRPKKWMGFFSALNRIPLIDYIFAASGAFAAVYIILDQEGLAIRAGDPSVTDVVIGFMLIFFLLEATRRAIGPALVIIVLLFTAYSFFGSYMPDFMAFKGVSMNKYLNQISLSSEGIYGIPLGVSASIVYLYVLLGAMLDKAGAGKFFIDLALSLLGRFKGGPAKAAVVASGFTGLISGSSVANIVTTGTFTIPLMKKVGYPPTKAAATEVAASTDGQLMPPVMGAAAFIIAEYVNVPYIEVCKAAIVPAFVSYFALFYVTHLEASKLGMKGLPREECPRFFETVRRGMHFLIPIFVLIFELVVMRHSPERAAFNAIMLLIGIIFVREIVFFAKGEQKSFIEIFKKSVTLVAQGFIAGSRNMVSVALATAAAGIIVGIVGMGIGGMITQIVETLSQGNVFVLLLITAVASMLLGMGLPTTATYIVMASLTAPIIVELGASYGLIVPLMAAHLFCFYFGILADDTPPVGLASYAASALAGSDPIPTGIQGFLYDLRTAIIPFMFVFNHDLILDNIYSWPLALLIFSMACIGAFAFTSVIQRWFITNNKIWEIPLLLLATLILFHPSGLHEMLGYHIENKYLMYIPGLAIMAFVYAGQKYRVRKAVA